MTNYDRQPVTPAPAVPVAPAAPASYSATLAQLTSSGWQLVTEGPSGAQLKLPKKMKTLDSICAVIGVICLFFAWPLGLLLILIAVIDFAFLTKERTHFLSRDVPTMPPA